MFLLNAIHQVITCCIVCSAANSDDSDDDPISDIRSSFNVHIDVIIRSIDRSNVRINKLKRANIAEIMPSLNKVPGVVEETRALTITMSNYVSRLGQLEENRREADEHFAAEQ